LLQRDGPFLGWFIGFVKTPKPDIFLTNREFPLRA
jgi:beta-lactamase class D